MKQLCLGAALVMAGLAGGATVALADDYNGTWQVNGPANCPFRIVATVDGANINATATAQMGTASMKMQLAPDGSFSGELGALFFSKMSGHFEKNAIQVTVQSSRCGTVTASGTRT